MSSAERFQICGSRKHQTLDCALVLVVEVVEVEVVAVVVRSSCSSSSSIKTLGGDDRRSVAHD